MFTWVLSVRVRPVCVFKCFILLNGCGDGGLLTCCFEY